MALRKEFSKDGLNYSRARVELLDKRVRLLYKFFYDIINIKNELICLLWLIGKEVGCHLPDSVRVPLTGGDGG